MINVAGLAKPLSGAIAVFALLTLFASQVHVGGFRLGYGFMPLTTSLILLLAATGPNSGLPRYKWSVVVGLACSLVGDVLLMLPRGLFLAGLIAFLLAHMCYLVAFTTDCRVAAKAVPFLLWGAVGVCVLAGLWPRVPAALRLPVVAYAVFLLGMAAQAASRALVFRSVSATAAAVGAALFVASDTLLAVKKFGDSLAGSAWLVLATYFSAQVLMAFSVRFCPTARSRGGAPAPAG